MVILVVFNSFNVVQNLKKPDPVCAKWPHLTLLRLTENLMAHTMYLLDRLLEEWRENLDNNFTVRGVLMDLSTAFDCIPHDLLIAKLSAYGLNGNALKFIYMYLKNRKQCSYLQCL